MRGIKISSIILLVTVIYSQNENIYPVTINEIFPQITLQSIDGEDILINEIEKENILLVFPRGMVTETTWCPICHYQYLEMALLDKNENIREKFNMEIIYIIPYSSDTLQSWINSIPQSLQSINNWKYPNDEENISDNVRLWMEYSREFFPHTFKYEIDSFTPSFPILFDPDKTVSKGLGLFREQWGGTNVDQNVPTIFLLDKDRKVRYKYFSQYTNDRPDTQYIVEYLELLLDM